MDLGRPLRRKLDERDILDDVREQPLALAVRETRIAPKRCKVCRHGDEAITDRVVENELVLLAPALSFLPRASERAQLVVPLAFERVGDKTVGWVDEHESPLTEISVDLSALDGATTELVSLGVPRFDLSSVQTRLQ
jgi:hypothetical protein